MRKILALIAVLVGLLGATNAAAEIKLTNALAKDIEKAYGFYLGQEYSLTQISKKYPSLRTPALIAKKEFSATFKSSIEGMDTIMMKHAKSAWRTIKTQITEQIPHYNDIDQINKSQAHQFIDLVRQRAKGDIKSPIIGTLLLFKSGYERHPEREFLDGFRHKYTTDGDGKAKGVAFSIEYPKSWTAKEGNRPHIVQKFVSENGRGGEVFLILVKEMPLLPGEKITEKDMSELLNADTIKLSIPRNATFIKSGKLTLERLPGFWVSYKINTSRARTSVSMEAVAYTIFYKNKMIQIQGEVAISVNGEIKNQGGLTKYEKLFDQMANSFVLTSRYQFKHTKKATGSKFQTSRTTINPKDRIISNKSLTSPPKKNSTTIIAPVFAVSTEQSSKGVMEEDMNQKFLQYFEAWMVETCKKKTMLAYAELGHDPSNFHPEITSKSQYVYIEGKKLAVISVSSHGGDKIVRGVKIIGFSAPGIVSTVACIRQSNHDIPIYTGVCGAKIKEVFGVGIPTQ